MPTPEILNLLNKAVSLHRSGQLDDALRLYQQVIKKDPKCFDAIHLIGCVYQQKEDHPKAVEQIQRAIDLYGRNPIFHANLANSLAEIGEFQKALKHYEKALALDPGNIEVLLNRAATMIEVGQWEEATARIEALLEKNRRNDSAWYNLGLVNKSINRLQKAKQNFLDCLSINGKNTKAMFELAMVHMGLNELKESVVVLDILLQHEPENESAWAQRGTALYEYGRVDLAIESLSRSFEADHNYVGHLLWICLNSVYWQRHEELQQSLIKLIRDSETGHNSNTFCALTTIASAADLLCSLSRWAKLYRPPIKTPEPKITFHSKIKIALVSGDFKNHPVSHLLAEVIELIDRERFEVIGVNINDKKDHDSMTERLVRSFDQYILGMDMDDPELWQHLRDMEIDIAVDLAGHTAHNRISVFARRIAPVQVNYIGYPGTMGATFIDYIIADPIVIPPEMSQYYVEEIVYMPDTFQPNDRSRVVADTPSSRSEVGLPEEALIFCCFCNNYKYNPAMFDAWAQILLNVSGSALWLLANNDTVSKHIVEEMQKRGIEAERLVFGGRLPTPQYLARYRLADLFLDTFPFNGGTTVSDALWAGLPVLTLAGETFASRMAASLLTAVGLPQMVTKSLEEYKARAIELGQNRKKLFELKTYLMTQGSKQVLFDTPRYVRHLEQAFTAMFQRASRGEKPSPLWVQPEVAA
jgi:predicted O-linked N-acetylglucosamine transferase (SPINDLY family)